MDLKALTDLILELGAHKVGTVAVEDIDFEPEFRKMCERNACGMYGRNWMCPPLVGEVDELIARAKQYQWAVVYQTVDELEDSYDFTGMMAAADKMNRITDQLRQRLEGMDLGPRLLLGAGGCHLCQRCAKQDDQPCRFPEKALASLEAYGINVSTLAPQAGMKYINGANTVTYFGAVFLGKR